MIVKADHVAGLLFVNHTAVVVINVVIARIPVPGVFPMESGVVDTAPGVLPATAR